MNQRYLKAYATAAGARSQREQDAEVFRIVSQRLQSAATELDRVRAIADARRLWQTVLDACRDPLNPLPEALRAQIVSVAEVVTRDLASAAPNVDFVLQVTTTMADALSGRSAPGSTPNVGLPRGPERLSCPA